MQDIGTDEIRFERMGKAGVVTLTRPKSLNAITHSMVQHLAAALDAWSADDAVAAVVVRAEGRAFSAGGDIMDVYRAGLAGNPHVDFFRDEYRLNAAIRRFPKPYVALIDGVVMGGGVGISCHGSHRIMGERAVFAMPETGIGFFPDVGGSYILSRLRKGLGIYLGLTGARIGPGDAVAAGIATHAVPSAELDGILHSVAETGNPEAILAAVATNPTPTMDEARLSMLGRVFTLSGMDDVIQELTRLAAGGDDFASTTLDTLLKRSPTSLHVTVRQIAAGAMLSMDECMRMEFRILNRMLQGPDFYEGIRAVLVDRDNAPRWRPASLSQVSEADIATFFAPPPGGDLQLP